ncbi:DUF3604 domain-containing protein [Halieaceae bacterium IMCC14734]|uniref:DUF3604 domain-containing protein n=1 Tax=Candidatus Litorirhabdus singularis TaxID=2518993 RepID=A0ABT3TF97_9GAMM|nr:DUF3604 domain-containing protein [Candidatus Litorirhabdus singularis]MCX2980865.1 DUF3604 domain-containing protein [Candidatus Litorirhabdus singularis]
MKKDALVAISVALLVTWLVSSASADYAGSILGNEAAIKQSIIAAEKKPLKEAGYSPYAGKNYPGQVLWGDTHLHTKLSLDARAFGATLGPEQAYRLARGEEITSSHGERIKLSRALDWLVIADHSDAMGAMDEVIKGNPELLKDPTVRDWYDRLARGGDSQLQATMEIIETFAGVSGDTVPAVLTGDAFVMSVWERYLETADAFNDPGNFSAIIGYEWTSTEGGNNLHRNVIYRGGSNQAKQMLPYTAAASFNPEDLWKWMARYEDKSGGQVLALAHNGNVSNGIMFPEINPETGKPLTKDYVSSRSRWEPLYEITQIKGDSESHPLLSPNDEFAGYDTLWDKGNLGPVPKEDDMLQYEYAREALKNGLKIESTLGVNPYKFGVVGSTDSHTGMSTAEEENFFGKHSGKEPHSGRWEQIVGDFDTVKYYGWEQVGAGYAAVWATENTREAIWDAMKRKEVYATTGPRIILRFFGGWDFTEDDARLRDPGLIGYSKGVPMGGDLGRVSGQKTPTFLVAALKDPYSGNLDRIQVVKGWLDKNGDTHEHVYDVVWSDTETRQPDKEGKLPPVGNTVNVEEASWSNTIGDSELITVWKDPDFDRDQKAFYYARVLEIPTPRWTAYDAKRFGDTMDKNVPMTTDERAYSSPIWYTP